MHHSRKRVEFPCFQKWFLEDFNKKTLYPNISFQRVFTLPQVMPLLQKKENLCINKLFHLSSSEYDILIGNFAVCSADTRGAKLLSDRYLKVY